ncbi:MAG: class I SAM-dependent methyltransferase [Rhizobiales bacterium]|nr:class I SAM-dependent methyltransferase [Hyphomicrobiales bacterium]
MSRLLDLDLRTGRSVIDRYLDNGYAHVRGMSSRFAGAVSAWLLVHQTEEGVRGDVVEIGTFEGRYFIALALALADDEKALGIDSFDWPSERTLDNFRKNCATHGARLDRIDAWKTNASTLTAEALRDRVGAALIRFFHIDGDHSPEPLLHDLSLATAVLHPKGLICLDDMLHPAYPFLVATVRDYLEAHPDMRVMAIIDREDIIGAAKFLLCRADAVPLYENALMKRYPQRHFTLGGDALGHHCVVLTPQPRLAVVD